MVNEGVPVCPSRPVRFPTQPCPLPNDRQSPTADRTTDLIAYVQAVRIGEHQLALHLRHQAGHDKRLPKLGGRRFMRVLGLIGGDLFAHSRVKSAMSNTRTGSPKAAASALR